MVGADLEILSRATQTSSRHDSESLMNSALILGQRGGEENILPALRAFLAGAPCRGVRVAGHNDQRD